MRRARQTGRTRLRRQRGLTLIEVLVALAIIAVALAAALRATGLMAANNRALQDKALAPDRRAERAGAAAAGTDPARGRLAQPCPQGGLRLECELVFTNSMNRSFRQVSVRVRDANAPRGARWRSWTGCCRACDESAPPAAPSSASR